MHEALLPPEATESDVRKVCAEALEYGFIDKVITSAREAADEGRPARAQ